MLLTSYYFKTALLNTAVYTVAAVIGVILFGLIVGSLLNTKIRSVNALKIIISVTLGNTCGGRWIDVEMGLKF